MDDAGRTQILLENLMTKVDATLEGVVSLLDWKPTVDARLDEHGALLREIVMPRLDEQGALLREVVMPRLDEQGALLRETVAPRLDEHGTMLREILARISGAEAKAHVHN